MYTPQDGDNWMLAKLNLQITDLGYAQIVEHLGKVDVLISLWKIIATPIHFTFITTEIVKTEGHIPCDAKIKYHSLKNIHWSVANSLLQFSYSLESFSTTLWHNTAAKLN